jgi:hypothetical protein
MYAGLYLNGADVISCIKPQEERKLYKISKSFALKAKRLYFRFIKLLPGWQDS